MLPMANRRPEPPNAFTETFTNEQRQRLPEITWNFLASDNRLPEDEIHHLRPKNIKDYALDFVNSDIGRVLWPWSKQNTWTFPKPQDEVAGYVTGVMTKEIRRRKRSPQYLVDHGPRNNGPRPSKPSKTNKTQTQETGVASPAAQESKLVGLPVSTMSLSEGFVTQMPVTSLEDTIECASKSLAKTPNMASGVTANLTSPPIPAALEISPAKSPQANVEKQTVNPILTQALSDAVTQERLRDTSSHMPQTTENPNVAPIVGQKRRAEYSGEDSVLDPPATSLEEVRRKRVATNASFCGSRSGIQEKEIINLSPQINGTFGDFTEAETRSSVTTSGPPTAIMDREPLVLAAGTYFTVGNLAKLPDILLGYVDKCRIQSIRSSESNDNQQRRGYHRHRATIYRDICSDLESRVKSLATDSDPKDMVISDYCLWATED